jgi:hypothetical protein
MGVRVWKEHRKPSETEQAAIMAIDRMEKHAESHFSQAIDLWWNKVLMRAKQLCIEMGAFDTGTLHDTIRIVAEAPSGRFFEVMAGPQGVISVDRMIVAGGMLINPKTGNICNYAESVHEGSGKNANIGPRPFLELAVIEYEPELERIMSQFMREQQREWERD